MESRSESFEQAMVACVPDRIALWIEPQGKSQAGHRGRACDLIDRRLSQLAVFESGQLRVGHPRCRGGHPQAEASGYPGREQVLSGPSGHRTRSTCAAIGGALASGHAGAMVGQGDHLRITVWDEGRPWT
jgi:hypothetical protein